MENFKNIPVYKIFERRERALKHLSSIVDRELAKK